MISTIHSKGIPHDEEPPRLTSQVRCIASSGRGVVTACPLHAGELLLAERALQADG